MFNKKVACLLDCRIENRTCYTAYPSVWACTVDGTLCVGYRVIIIQA